MTRNCELDTSVDEAISYYSALQILQQRISELTAEEFCTWVVLGYLHAFELVNDGGGEAELATKLLTVSQPFAGADHRSKPLDLLLPYKFSRNEIETFDPGHEGSDWNPSGRFLTYEQAGQHLARYSGQEYAEKLIDRELRSGALRPIHPVLGVHTPGAEIESLNLDFEDPYSGDEGVLVGLMFPSAGINQLRVEEFKGIEPHGQAERSDLVTSVESTPRTDDLGSGNPFRCMTDLRWDEIVIQFITPEAVRIRARRIKARYTYAEMGFKDGRSRDASPDCIWRRLYLYAKYRGEVDWRTENIDEENRKMMKRTVSTIRKRLKAFFGIDDDPFHSYRKEGSYKTKFMLLRDQDCLDDYRVRSGQGGGDDDNGDDLESLMSEPPFS